MRARPNAATAEASCPRRSQHFPATGAGPFPCQDITSKQKWPFWGHFPFAQIADTRLGLYASRSQSKATRGVPSDTYTIPARLNPALAMAPCMGRLS